MSISRGDGGDLVELDPLGVAEVERLGEVPGDRLALPVGVGGEDDLAVTADGGLQLTERLAAALNDLVGRLEAGVHVDRERLLGQVADVSHRGPDVVAVPEEPL